MVLLVLVYVAFFAVGSGPVTWVMLSEVLPPRIKGPAASLATAAGWAGAWWVGGWVRIVCKGWWCWEDMAGKAGNCSLLSFVI